VFGICDYNCKIMIMVRSIFIVITAIMLIIIIIFIILFKKYIIH